MNPAHPAHLRRTATVARHHAMPTIAAALDAAADRIEGLEGEVARLEAIADTVADFFEGVEASREVHHG